MKVNHPTLPLAPLNYKFPSSASSSTGTAVEPHLQTHTHKKNRLSKPGNLGDASRVQRNPFNAWILQKKALPPNGGIQGLSKSQLRFCSTCSHCTTAWTWSRYFHWATPALSNCKTAVHLSHPATKPSGCTPAVPTSKYEKQPLQKEKSWAPPLVVQCGRLLQQLAKHMTPVLGTGTAPRFFSSSGL